MAEFLQAVLAYPTVIFSALLSVVCLYWLFVIVGAIGIDVLDLEVDADVDADMDVDVDVDVDAGDIDGPDGDGHEFLNDFLNFLGIGTVPLTISLSIFLLLAWTISLLAQPFQKALTNWGIPGWVTGTSVGFASLVIAGLAGGVILRPFRKFFKAHLAQENTSLIGKLCTVTTLRVDSKFGQAEVDASGGVLIQVRCAEDNRLSRGSRALIIDYCAKDEVFHISPLDDTLAKVMSGVGTSTHHPSEGSSEPDAPTRRTRHKKEAQ